MPRTSNVNARAASRSLAGMVGKSLTPSTVPSGDSLHSRRSAPAPKRSRISSSVGSARRPRSGLAAGSAAPGCGGCWGDGPGAGTAFAGASPKSSSLNPASLAPAPPTAFASPKSSSLNPSSSPGWAAGLSSSPSVSALSRNWSSVARRMAASTSRSMSRSSSMSRKSVALRRKKSMSRRHCMLATASSLPACSQNAVAAARLASWSGLPKTTTIWLLLGITARASRAATTAGVSSGKRSSMFERIWMPAPHPPAAAAEPRISARLSQGRRPAKPAQRASTRSIGPPPCPLIAPSLLPGRPRQRGCRPWHRWPTPGGRRPRGRWPTRRGPRTTLRCS